MHDDVLAGVRDSLPFQLGVVPFGMVTGIAAIEVGLSPAQAVGASALVTAGASQLAAYELLGETAPLAVVIGTALVINLRMVMYSASIAPYFASYDRRIRAVLAHLLVDPVYATSVAEFERRESRDRMRYYLGLGVPIWIGWILGTVLGVAFGTALPAGLELSFAIPLIFLALLAPAVTDRASTAAAAVAGLVALAGGGLPFNFGLLGGGLAGIGAGLLVAHREGA